MAWRATRTVEHRHIRQGNTGSCYLLAASIGNLEFTRKRGDRKQLRFTFYDEQGEVRYVRQRQAGTVTEAIDSAYAKFRRKEYGDNKYDTLHGGKTQQAVQDVLGVTGVNRDWMTSSDELLSSAKAGEQLDVYSSHPLMVYAHAYSIVDVQPNTITLYNPWSIDSHQQVQGMNDGLITLDRPLIDGVLAGGTPGYGVLGLIDNPFI